MNKVLIISYYFPPMGMGGVQRTLKFAKYLTRYNWQPVVLTINPRKYYAIDEHLLEEALSNGIIIERTGKKELNVSKIVTRVPKERFRKIRSIISQFFFIPDSKIFWKNKALRKIDEIWEKYDGFDLVYATAPPYTDFLIGQEVKRKYKIPLVTDYRDAWVDSPVLNFYPTPLHKRANIKRERKVVKDANIILTTNRRVKEFIIRRYENIKYNDIKIFPHGYDSEDFELALTKKLPLTNKMRITYSGSFYTRNPKFYFDAIKVLLDKHPEIRNKIEFLFLGIITKEHLNYAKHLNILDVLNQPGYVNHHECIKYIMASDILFLLVSRGENEDAAMPGKLGEYIGSRKNIIACIPEGVTKKLLQDYNAIKFIPDENPESIAEAIYDYFVLFEMNAMPAANEELIRQYDRKTMTAELAKELNYLLDIE
ncbi:MAG: glycosyltransferase [Ignavibacteria bacterium]|nr:glycosyltransferase [Ignavibacteria bacterium]